LEQYVKKPGFAMFKEDAKFAARILSGWATVCRDNEMAGEEAALKMSVCGS
jgi:hypothetical protein